MRLLLALTACLSFSAIHAPRFTFEGTARAQTDLTFVRHGETVANATGRYRDSTLNTFSERGKKGVEALTGQLQAEPAYARILVSPAPRALRTIAPYLAGNAPEGDSLAAIV